MDLFPTIRSQNQFPKVIRHFKSLWYAPQDFRRSENGGDSAGAQITTPDFHPCDSSISVRVNDSLFIITFLCKITDEAQMEQLA